MGQAIEPAGERFRDPLVRLWGFLDEILVRCPRCDRKASVLPVPREETAGCRPTAWRRRSVTCLSCGYAAYVPQKEKAGLVFRIGGDADAYFGLPLWLTTDCRSRALWAYNAEHLDLLEDFVAARLRERGPVPGTMSMIERLPAWIKDGKHRDDVLKALQRLRAMATQ
jgi:hypothetical protein